LIEVEVLGARRSGAGGTGAGGSGAGGTRAGLSPRVVRALCVRALAARGVRQGHVAVHFVNERRIAELNGRHRGVATPTDVLAFPIDGPEAAGAPADEPAPELGDVFVCVARSSDVREAIVHGVLHLTGMDHEHDRGEMLALQARLLDEKPARGVAS
jgi:probable rRNA maturation factor